MLYLSPTRLITFEGGSVRLAYHVDKCDRKTANISTYDIILYQWNVEMLRHYYAENGK